VDDEEQAFRRLYGPWADQTPEAVARLLDGLEAPWWISGGWAIEAFTGVERRHEDVDVTIFRADVPALRRHFAGSHHLWAAGSGTLRPIDDARPRIPGWSAQIWVREHALAPWLLDILLNASRRGRWVFRRDPSVVRPLDEATWLAADGLRYLRPELVLAHKVRFDREKDDSDLAATLPLLDAESRGWLADFVDSASPGHRWGPRLR
jgi:Aminoglycoside-2''-adenylyltransferase